MFFFFFFFEGKKLSTYPKVICSISFNISIKSNVSLVPVIMCFSGNLTSSVSFGFLIISATTFVFTYLSDCQVLEYQVGGDTLYWWRGCISSLIIFSTAILLTLVVLDLIAIGCHQWLCQRRRDFWSVVLWHSAGWGICNVLVLGREFAILKNEIILYIKL